LTGVFGKAILIPTFIKLLPQEQCPLLKASQTVFRSARRKGQTNVQSGDEADCGGVDCILALFFLQEAIAVYSLNCVCVFISFRFVISKNNKRIPGKYGAGILEQVEVN
jgi:hypothetical protein